MRCVHEVCSAHAIDMEAKEKVYELEVGAVVMATGFDMFDVKKLHEYDTSCRMSSLRRRWSA